MGANHLEAVVARKSVFAADAVATAGLGLMLTLYLRRQQRFDLAALDERGLKDVGLTRADVAREVDKPFWR